MEKKEKDYLEKKIKVEIATVIVALLSFIVSFVFSIVTSVTAKDTVQEIKNQYTIQIDDFEFVWITDGIGWKDARRNLEEIFDVMELVYSLNDLENNNLIDLLK